ncbi:histone family protein nucleoid-structuring protein H-NS [Caballeronia pedi]|uniref:Histone family protein nucleoid-structuring protein H-NS n=1 Tax=Caballeronia pedi TaxID=1777141 RepID=A0A157ZI36_9BURK|nr:H-NS histone family protein [Caballeronia pedi]SAK45214.1 histone family protein nucleoid-structuring protein H-NS [Caballeronia pedi]
MATLAQLESQIQKLQRRADALRERKSAEVIARIREMMEEFGLTIADLAKAGLGAEKKRGRPAGSRNVSGSKKGAAKSKLPPKYRDPVSGATWSGHARPPAWIKNVLDRSVYLIDGAPSQIEIKEAPRRARVASASRVGGGESANGIASETGQTVAKKSGRKSAQSVAA